MLCAIHKETQQSVFASLVEREHKPFYCQCCKDLVILKKGQIRTHHFAHKPPVTCEYGVGETEKHRQCKMEIYNFLKGKPYVRNLKMEAHLGNVRPDISAYIKNFPVAIEVQCSNLSLETIIQRTKKYYQKNVFVLWISPWSKGLQ
ncbi:competence protein CoiA, partial [Candidatus Falkowbacteria bacterium]|nr:competence protein CoiA [Candidatus Falkowbacteria bacterium]